MVNNDLSRYVSQTEDLWGCSIDNTDTPHLHTVPPTSQRVHVSQPTERQEPPLYISFLIRGTALNATITSV